MSGKNYRDLIVWQKSVDLSIAVYRVTKGFPKEELYALSSQLRRAAVSIPSNIAEGQGRHSKKDFAHFLSIAYGSLREIETQIHIAMRLGYIRSETESDLQNLCGEVGRLLNALIKSLSREQ
jgi:four helix bundle protein